MSESNAAETQKVDTAPETGGDQANEKLFTQADVDRVVKQRVKEEQKRLGAQQSAQKRPNENVEEDLKAKLAESEQLLKSHTDRLKGYRLNQLKSVVERECARQGCTDPELLASHFLSRNVVRYQDDEDDDVVVDNARNSLEELVKDELSRRPHLVKSPTGLGTKGPGHKLSPGGKSPREMSQEEYLAWKEEQGITKPSDRLFNF